MAANSLPRRVLKRVLAPVLNDRTYRVFQGVAMAWDIRTGRWREPELDLIRYVVREGDTALDIGANYGLYSYYLSRAVGASGRVYAFEPVPFTGETFKVVARLLHFRNVDLVGKGCGSAPGRLSFTVPLQENGAVMAGQAHMCGRDDNREGKEKHARFGRVKEIECEVITIDDYLPGLQNVSFIKCDIEGADLYALRGAAKTIDNNQPIVVCEINPWFLEGFGIRLEELLGFFSERGYQIHRYDRQKLTPATPDQIVEDNWVFIHPNHHARLAPLLAG
jgi:FkbM family methyltransferase